MEKRLYKQLWGLRFKKMLHLEEKAAADYEALLRECRAKYGEHSIIPDLERLISDEKKHARLVKELLDILGRQTG